MFAACENAADTVVTCLIRSARRSIHSKAEYFNRFFRRTISEVLDETDEAKFRIMCTIFNIDMNFGFYYFVCNKCTNTAFKVPKKENEIVSKSKKALFWCKTCNESHSKVIPRFKLILDVMDSSGELKCMMFDNSAPKIINQNVDEIFNGVYDEIQDPTNVPDCLKSLVEKTFQFLINIDKDNIHGGNDTYKVSYVELGDDAEHVDPPQDSNVPIDHNSLISVDQDQDVKSNSNETDDQIGTASTTPSSKRSNNSTEDTDENSSSTTKKICVTSISDAIEKEVSGGLKE
ncbi:unnamed protein product [Arabidopsis arenosa]|uniref:Replication factor A C-terminal domain-containing protein n=1 Tax=Arabidopsis arenosa TaxID=38785 RepID=A0A8S2AXR4_ARAAE|nr:unnamed protein product [Arabidopsis arenosa]